MKPKIEILFLEGKIKWWLSDERHSLLSHTPSGDLGIGQNPTPY